MDPGSARLVVADREVEAITAAGLKGLGASGGMGRHGLDRALRILPGIVRLIVDNALHGEIRVSLKVPWESSRQLLDYYNCS